MASYAGLKTRDRAERAEDRRRAEDEIADIEAAEQEFREFAAGWAKRHSGDKSARFSESVDDLLSDYFFERRTSADQQELGW